MQITNIEKKIKITKEKTEVLGGRISPTKMMAFNLIAEALDVSTAELFKATIDECIESFFKSMLKIDRQKAMKLVDGRLDKLMKKSDTNTFHFRDYTLLTPAEQKIASLNHMKNFPNEIPLFWFFDDIKLDFNRETEQTNKERWIAYKNYLDEIEEKENMELSKMIDKMEEQNAIVDAELKEESINRKIVSDYYDHINSGTDIPKDLQNKFNTLDTEFVEKYELLQYPFVKDENGKQKYSDEEILNAVNQEMTNTITFGKNKKDNKFHNIQEIHEYAQKNMQKQKEEQEAFLNKLEIIGAKEGEYNEKDFKNIEEDPFGITDSFLSKQRLPDEIIVKYWKYYMNDLEYFNNRDFTVENIKSYTILKHDNIINTK